MTLGPVTDQQSDASPDVAPDATASAGSARLTGSVIETAPVQDELPLLADPPPRAVEHVAAATKESTAALPVFIPPVRVPMAVLLLVLPALEAAGLQKCMQQTYS